MKTTNIIIVKLTDGDIIKMPIEDGSKLVNDLIKSNRSHVMIPDNDGCPIVINRDLINEITLGQ